MDGMSLEESLSGIDSSLFRLFREKTSDLQYPKLEKDQYIARWLKARSWDVEKAEKMFRVHLEWRNEVKVGLQEIILLGKPFVYSRKLFFTWTELRYHNLHSLFISLVHAFSIEVLAVVLVFYIGRS